MWRYLSSQAENGDEDMLDGGIDYDEFIQASLPSWRPRPQLEACPEGIFSLGKPCTRKDALEILKTARNCELQQDAPPCTPNRTLT